MGATRTLTDKPIERQILAEDGVNEVQNVAVAGTAGDYTLTFDAQETGAIAFNAPAEEVEAALEALSTIGSGNVTVTGGPGDADGVPPYVVTFVGDLAETNVSTLVADDTGLTGTGVTVTVVTAGSDGRQVAAHLTDVVTDPESPDAVQSPTGYSGAQDGTSQDPLDVHDDQSPADVYSDN